MDRSGWRIIGPGGGGTMFIPTVSPHDPETAVVVCDMTGSYVTSNGGLSWSEFNLKSMVEAVAFDPVDRDTIYAGATGLYRSADSGIAWQLIFPDPASVTEERTLGDHAAHSYISEDNWPGGNVENIKVDPADPASIFIAIRSVKQLLVFRSRDRGRSWTPVLEPEGSAVRQLYVDSSSPVEDRELFVFTDSSLYRVQTGSLRVTEIGLPPRMHGIKDAACGINPSTGEPVFFAIAPVRHEDGVFSPGIMRSVDRGRSWEELRGGLDRDFPADGASRRWFTSIGMSERDASAIYLAVWREQETDLNRNAFGMMKSTDFGDSWHWVIRASDAFPDDMKTAWFERSYDTNWVGAPLNLGVCPSNPEVCYYTNMGTAYRTMDGGASWQQLYANDYPDGSASTRGLDVTTCYGVHFDPFDPEHVVIAYTDMGMFDSRNGGESWSHRISGVPQSWINTCYWLVFDPDVQGRAWSVWGEAHDLPRLKLFENNNFDRYTGGVCRSDDALLNWAPSNGGMPANCVCTHIVLDPRSAAGERTLYVTGFGNGVFKSVDDGRTWLLKNRGIGDNRNAWWLALTPAGVLYLLTARGLRDGEILDGALYRSADGAETWEPVSMPDGVNAPNDLAVDPEFPERLYLACWPTTNGVREEYGGVYKSEDGGLNWVNIFDPSSHVFGIAVDAANPSTLYIVTFEGTAWRSDDRGSAWRQLAGYDFKWGHRPFVDPHNRDKLYITTFGSSVWYGPTE